jgi:hypothetical protein
VKALPDPLLRWELPYHREDAISTDV